MKKIVSLLTYVDTGMVVLLSLYVILVLYNMITASIYIPVTLAVIYIIFLLLEKDDAAKAKVKSLITVLPIISLAIVASIKKFM